jgi:hypothetical protein
VTDLVYTASDAAAGDSVATSEPGLMLTFRNVTVRPVDEVVFAVNDASGCEVGIVIRRGTFSPGVAIRRYVGDAFLKGTHGVPVQATPIAVGFANGTSWASTR